jgi:hypothetical protein
MSQVKAFPTPCHVVKNRFFHDSSIKSIVSDIEKREDEKIYGTVTIKYSDREETHDFSEGTTPWPLAESHNLFFCEVGKFTT